MFSNRERLRTRTTCRNKHALIYPDPGACALNKISRNHIAGAQPCTLAALNIRPSAISFGIGQVDSVLYLSERVFTSLLLLGLGHPVLWVNLYDSELFDLTLNNGIISMVVALCSHSRISFVLPTYMMKAKWLVAIFKQDQIWLLRDSKHTKKGVHMGLDISVVQSVNF